MSTVQKFDTSRIVYSPEEARRYAEHNRELIERIVGGATFELYNRQPEDELPEIVEAWSLYYAHIVLPNLGGWNKMPLPVLEQSMSGGYLFHKPIAEMSLEELDSLEISAFMLKVWLKDTFGVRMVGIRMWQTDELIAL
jgi:hypothetical protein